MSLTQFALGSFLIIYGLSHWMAISPVFIAVLAIIAGVLVLIDGWHPVTIWRRPAA